MKIYEILLQRSDGEIKYGYVRFRCTGKNFYDALTMAETKIITLRAEREIKYEIVKIEMLG